MTDQILVKLGFRQLFNQSPVNKTQEGIRPSKLPLKKKTQLVLYGRHPNQARNIHQIVGCDHSVNGIKADMIMIKQDTHLSNFQVCHRPESAHELFTGVSIINKKPHSKYWKRL